MSGDTTPRDERERRRHTDIWGAATAAVLALIVGVSSLRAWEWRPGIPLSIVGDSPLVLTQLDDILRNGWFWSNDAIGFPLSQNASFYPELDVVHIFGVKLVGLLSSDAGTVGGVYFLVCYPLIALTTYLLCRSEGLKPTASVVVAVLFAAAPYHAERFQHFWLAAYWTVPVAVWLVLLVARGRTPVDPGGPRTQTRVAIWVGALALVGLSGAYYSGFTLILFATMLLLRAGAGRDSTWWRGGLVSIAGVAAVAALPLVAARIGMAGTAVTGIRPASRNPLESGPYAGRIIDLALPWEGHRAPALANLTNLYQAAGPPVFETVALGVIGLCGVTALLLLGLRALATFRDVRPRLLLWASLVGVCGLFYTTGGLGSIVALLATPQLRTWSRLSLFILLLGLMTVGHWLSRPRAKAGAMVLAAGVLLVGVLDQTNPARAPRYANIHQRLEIIRAYTAQLADATSNECGVFQLPVMRFPEGRVPPGYDINAQLLQHLTTTRRGWSHGGMSGTQAGDWPLGVDLSDPPTLLRELRSAGFCALEVDTAGVAEDNPALSSVTQRLGEPVALSADGRLIAWSLTDVDGGTEPDRSRLLEPVLVGMASGEIIIDGARAHQDVGPVSAVYTENLSSDSIGPILVSVGVTALGAPEREVVVKDGDTVLARATVTADAPVHLTVDVTAPPGYHRFDVTVSGEPARDMSNSSISARFENLKATSTADAHVASQQDQAVSKLVYP